MRGGSSSLAGSDVEVDGTRSRSSDLEKKASGEGSEDSASSDDR